MINLPIHRQEEGASTLYVPRSWLPTMLKGSGIRARPEILASSLTVKRLGRLDELRHNVITIL